MNNHHFMERKEERMHLGNRVTTHQVNENDNYTAPDQQADSNDDTGQASSNIQVAEKSSTKEAMQKAYIYIYI